MKFTPKTEQELQSARLLPEGTYAFDVLSAEDRLSKAGNEMIALELLVYTQDGGTRKVRDFLMEKMAFKLAAFARTTGLTAKYSEGRISSEDCLGKSGWLKLTVESGKPKADGSGNYPDRNSVKDYTTEKQSKVANLTAPSAAPAKASEKAADAAAASSGLDEDVPF